MKVTTNFSEINIFGKFNKIVLESSHGQFQITQILQAKFEYYNSKVDYQRQSQIWKKKQVVSFLRFVENFKQLCSHIPHVSSSSSKF